MKKQFITSIGVALAMLIGAILPVQAQQPPPRLLTIPMPSGTPIIPVMEGWSPEADGSVTISFGYINRNTEEVEIIPHGPNNRIEPASLDGHQPTVFETGRHTGAFTVNIPADMASETIWWHIKTGNHEATKAPGRGGAAAYELDWRPRPQGSVQPTGSFSANGPQVAGLYTEPQDFGRSVAVGTPVTLTAYVNDPSERDRTDDRFVDLLPVGVSFHTHQGPAPVTFERHSSTVIPEPDPNARFRRPPPGPNYVPVADGGGTANVNAIFNEPGEYMIRVLVQNYTAPDSSAGDQCCWTNLYQKITVTP